MRPIKLHPIHYSLIFNLISLGTCAWLAYVFTQPLLVVIALMIAQHAMARFEEDDQEDDDLEDAQSIGFTADIK